MFNSMNYLDLITFYKINREEMTIPCRIQVRASLRKHKKNTDNRKMKAFTQKYIDLITDDLKNANIFAYI